MLRGMTWILLISCTVGALPASGAGSGGTSMGGGGAASSARPRSPEQVANSAYKSGLSSKKRALKYERKAADASSDKKRTSYLDKARRQYEKAVDKYREAFTYNSEFHEALNELGFAYRKLGDYHNAVRAYNTALNVEPGYPQAIEYRGEAYLALGMLDSAKEAYLTLFRSDQDLATLLMSAMQTWIESPSVEPGAELDAFVTWVEERGQLAEGTQTLSLNNVRDW